MARPSKVVLVLVLVLAIVRVLVSGSWTPAQRDRARELSAARLLAKPVDLGQLARDGEEMVG